MADSVYSLNKASLLKRIAAFIIDIILVIIIATGVGTLVSKVVDYDSHYAKLEEKYIEHGMYIPNPEYKEGEPEYIACEIQFTEKGEVVSNDPCYAAMNSFAKDEEAVRYSDLCDTLVLMILSVSCLIGVVIIDFVIPLLFKNGQTLGKKIMHIGLIGNDGIKIRPWMLFARTIIGRFAIETMVPLYCVLFLFVNITGGLVGILVLIILAIIELACLGFTKNHCAIHDIAGGTVVIDIDSQFIPKNRVELENAIKQEKEGKRK